MKICVQVCQLSLKWQFPNLLFNDCLILGMPYLYGHLIFSGWSSFTISVFMDAYRCLWLVFHLRIYKKYKTAYTNFLKTLQLQPSISFYSGQEPGSVSFFCIFLFPRPVPYQLSFMVVKMTGQNIQRDSKECKMFHSPEDYLDDIVLFPSADRGAFSVLIFCRMKQLQQDTASVLLRSRKHEWIPIGIQRAELAWDRVYVSFPCIWKLGRC